MSHPHTVIDPNSESIIPLPAGLANGRLLFWQRAAAWAFGIWAAMMPVTAVLVVNSMNTLAREQKIASEQMILYRESMERRVTLFEERQAVMMRSQERHSDDIELLKSKFGLTIVSARNKDKQ